MRDSPLQNAAHTFLVTFWGSDHDAAATLVPGDASHRTAGGTTSVWFSTHAERAAFARLLRHFEWVVFRQEDGSRTRYRTIAVFTLEKDGRAYDIEQDFGYGYDPESVHFMFNEGNYSCDDNRSLFIRSVDPTFPEHGCGDTITLKNLCVEFRP